MSEGQMAKALLKGIVGLVGIMVLFAFSGACFGLFLRCFNSVLR